MPGNRPSTPTLLAQGLMETLLQPLAGAVAPLNLPTDHLLHTHLSAFLSHDYEESEIDFLAVLLALSTQNNNLKQQISALAAQVQVLVTQTSSVFAETNFMMSQVHASVSSLGQTVDVAQTPNPVHHPPRNPQPAQPPARRQTTALPANPPASQGQAQSRPSFANVAARAGAAPVVDATPPKPQPLPTAQRRFFASRKVPKAFSDAPLLAGRLPVLVAKCLTPLTCQAPLAFTATVNKVSTVSLTANEFTSADVYAPYFDKLTAFLNNELPLSSDGPFEPSNLHPVEWTSQSMP